MPQFPLGRRTLVKGLMAGGGLALMGGGPVLARLSPPWAYEFGALEAAHGGRLGVYALGVDGLPGFSWREQERFAFCSAFKLSLAAMVLAGGDDLSNWMLEERLPISAADVVGHAPATRPHLGGTMSMVELAEAAVVVSDNGAANVLLGRVGGPAALTAFWRKLGDAVSRLDAVEPALNHVPSGSEPNTTSPAAMAQTLRRILVGDGVPAPGQEMLKGWLHASQTGIKRLRAGLPADWWVGDKTGTAYYPDVPGNCVDLAWVEPVGSKPFFVTAFYQSGRAMPDGDPQAEAVLAKVGQLVAEMITGKPSNRILF